MADKRPNKNKGGRPRKHREPRATIQVRASKAHHEALDYLSGLTKRSMNAELLVALESHLRTNGIWPWRGRPADA